MYTCLGQGSRHCQKRHFPYGGGGGAQPHVIAFVGVFPHDKGDSNKTTTKQQI